jgi:hypothetical protein
MFFWKFVKKTYKGQQSTYNLMNVSCMKIIILIFFKVEEPKKKSK